jgi:hypothetical protein
VTKLLAAVFALFALAGCDNAPMFWHSAADELRGPPSADALAQTARFEHGGIAFDYPAVMRLREDREDDGDIEWNLEYGMYTASIYAPKFEVTAAGYLGLLASLGEALDDPKLHPEPVELCGARREAAVEYVQLIGSPTRLEGFDLPAPPGESRLLLFSDEPVAGEPTALARATRERVLATLRCRKPK